MAAFVSLSLILSQLVQAAIFTATTTQELDTYIASSIFVAITIVGVLFCSLQGCRKSKKRNDPSVNRRTPVEVFLSALLVVFCIGVMTVAIVDTALLDFTHQVKAWVLYFGAIFYTGDIEWFYVLRASMVFVYLFQTISPFAYVLCDDSAVSTRATVANVIVFALLGLSNVALIVLFAYMTSLNGSFSFYLFAMPSCAFLASLCAIVLVILRSNRLQSHGVQQTINR
jgi:hypothetical protein